MLYLNKVLLAVAVSATLYDGAFAQFRGFGHFGGFGGGGFFGGHHHHHQQTSPTTAPSSPAPAPSAASNACLNPANIQTGSQQDGLAANGTKAGDAASLTDNTNFINFCTGKTLTNGIQFSTSSCNGIVMGDIPAVTNMVSTVILSPQTGQTIQAGTTFTASMQVVGLNAGVFTNADATYYTAPQQLGSNGNIVGHSHFTIQDIGSINTQTPPDPSKFVFFKGIDDAGNGAGLLSIDVTGGLPAGAYRICTLSATANHTPVIMPIAQRGAQDDCVKFTVSNNAGTGTGTGTSSAAVSAPTGGVPRAKRGRFVSRKFIA